MWDTEDTQKISGNKSKRRSIRMEVDFYEVFLSYIIYCLLFYIMTMLTQFFLPDFWHLSHRGKEVKEVFSTSILVRIVKGFR